MLQPSSLAPLNQYLGHYVQNVLLLGSNSWRNFMNRKTIKTRTQGVHVSLPIRMLEEFDEKVGFKGSRSSKIAQLMADWVRGHDDPLDNYACIEILENLKYRFQKDSPEDILIQALLALC